MTVIVAIDPGKSGAISGLIDGRPVIVEDMPVIGKHVSPILLHQLISDMGPDAIVLEQVGSSPQMGVTSAFNFGQNYGVILGVCANWPVTLVRPQVWKKHHRIPPRSDKEVSRALALRLYPHLAERLERKKDDGRAEACLIGQWLHDTQHNNQES